MEGKVSSKRYLYTLKIIEKMKKNEFDMLYIIIVNDKNEFDILYVIIVNDNNHDHS
jgi:hypothetical protein